MLVLSRKLNESIMIGDGMEIKVIGVRGRGENAVIRLGIVAPESVKILRKEVLLEVASQMREAANVLDLPEHLLDCETE